MEDHKGEAVLDLPSRALTERDDGITRIPAHSVHVVRARILKL